MTEKPENTSDYSEQKTMKSIDYPAQASDYKICPLRFGLERYATFDGLAVVDRPCTGHRCAWWDAMRERCGVLPRT